MCRALAGLGHPAETPSPKSRAAAPRHARRGRERGGREAGRERPLPPEVRASLALLLPPRARSRKEGGPGLPPSAGDGRGGAGERAPGARGSGAGARAERPIGGLPAPLSFLPPHNTLRGASVRNPSETPGLARAGGGARKAAGGGDREGPLGQGGRERERQAGGKKAAPSSGDGGRREKTPFRPVGYRVERARARGRRAAPDAGRRTAAPRLHAPASERASVGKPAETNPCVEG